MVLKLIATVGASIAVAVGPLPAHAVADETSSVLIQSGGMLCSVSANDVPRGGGPMVACQRSDGSPLPQAPFSTLKPYPLMNVAVVRGTGEFTYAVGGVAGTQPVNLGPGQTYHVNGWTIQVDSGKTTYTYDATKFGMQVGPDFVHAVWI